MGRIITQDGRPAMADPQPEEPNEYEVVFIALALLYQRQNSTMLKPLAKTNEVEKYRELGRRAFNLVGMQDVEPEERDPFDHDDEEPDAEG